MSRTVSGGARLVAALVSALVLALVGAQPAAASGATTSTWQLTDNGQKICIPAGKTWWTYFWITIDGHWTTPIEVGARNLPPGTVTSLPHSALPPGSSNGRTALDLIEMTLPPLAHGVYQPELTASDGVQTQSVPVTIQVQDEWGCPV